MKLCARLIRSFKFKYLIANKPVAALAIVTFLFISPTLALSRYYLHKDNSRHDAIAKFKNRYWEANYLNK
ncbi:hypothetical protein Phum_PHUM191780 [Pediculus humanus corporis]|uniref:Uncharacterized protein n=1 Tax=Pediculus humanus subsp. corporis TaxID=121224 RepID=E0VGS3_PEDHC|nr:uncharacterized protein Phum_PHUM191780 [Pediculus humanus corporis]EEB12579.1 hypothetical protein Phum_PHUM191780 [Pediculus humanus corporis]